MRPKAFSANEIAW